MKVNRRRVLLGITGSIAAYKGAELARKLTERGFQVTVVLTKNAAKFVASLTFEALSGNRVYTDMFASGEMLHIELERENDLILVAPATADFIAKIAHGIGDDLLSTIVLSRTHPMIVAPAMNAEMYLNPIVQRNLQTISTAGILVLPTGEGGLACGETGPGRMLEPEQIMEAVIRALSEQDLAGQKVVVTAGPTREPLDDVRFITNASTGRMGFAIAQAARRRGADVLLVTGPTELPLPEDVQVLRVTTASQMREAVLNASPDADFVYMAAAVSDYAPSQPMKGKPAKEELGEVLTVKLVKCPDILVDLAQISTNERQVRVGFAAEWGSPDLAKMVRKMKAKGADAMFVNDVSQSDIGFGAQENEGVWVQSGKSDSLRLTKMSKEELADRLLDLGLEIQRSQKVAPGRAPRKSRK